MLYLEGNFPRASEAVCVPTQLLLLVFLSFFTVIFMVLPLLLLLLLSVVVVVCCFTASCKNDINFTQLQNVLGY